MKLGGKRSKPKAKILKIIISGLMGNKILVTGGSGMLGAVLTRHLSSEHVVTALSKSGRNGTLVCDLTKEAEVQKLFGDGRFDCVIHTAAYSDVDGCEKDPAMAHASNALAVRHLAKICAAKAIPLVHVSTDYVFDGRKKTPYTEEDPTGPVNVYGMTKLAGEFYAAECPFSAIVRTSWLFGPGNPNSFVNAIVERLRTQKKVGVLEDQRDSPTSVVDLSEGLQKISETLMKAAKESSKTPRRQLFHFCNVGEATRLEMAQKIKTLLGLKNVEVERVDRQNVQGRLAIRPQHAVMSTKRYEAFFGVKIRPWEESLEEYLRRFVQ
jgi:dTDP-4-dehydrorhamnose reductase